MSLAESLSFYLSTGTTASVTVSTIETIASTASSTTSTNGALVVGGGVGVGGNLNVGGSITVGGVTYTSNNLAPITYQTYANGIASSFTLPFTPVGASGLIVTIDGLVEYDYTVSGNTLAFGFVPANTSIVRLWSTGVPNLVSTSTVGPGTVTTTSFQAGAIVGGLGYTPANKAGDSLTGSFTLNGWTIATGTAISSTATLMAQAVTATYAATAYSLASTATLMAQAVTATYAATAYSLASTATAYQYTSGTTTTSVLSPAVVWAAAAPVGLVDASTITIDLSTGINFTCTLTAAVGATRTLANPVNAKPGQTGWIQVTQSATGNNAVTFGNQWHFSTGTVTTVSNTANVSDLIYYTAISSTYFQTNIAKYWI
jgi:hypothetical protein